MCKKLVFTLIALCGLSTASAQFKSDFKLQVEGGFLDFAERDNFGAYLHFEPKLAASENTRIGLRIGLALNAQVLTNTDSTQFIIHDEYDNGTFSFVLTFERSWEKGAVRPFVGAGLGYYVLGNPIEASRRIVLDPATDEFELRVNRQPGALLRAGIENKNWRFGLEYNFVPKADIKLDGQTLGTVDVSYLGLSIGYVFGLEKTAKS